MRRRAVVTVLLLACAVSAVGASVRALSAQDAPRAANALPDSVLAKRLDSLLAATPGFSGVAVIGRQGQVIHTAVAGRARPNGAKPTAETAFNLGSITKTFTATLIRQVSAEQGWSLDTTVAALWPTYPNQDVARAITVRQLMNHMSGVNGDIFAGDAAARGHLRTLKDFLPFFVDNPLAFKPGARESYSNAGYVLLGLLLEERTGKRFDLLLEERIYRPAAMNRSAHYPRDSLPAFAAIGTTRRLGPDPVVNTTTLPGRGSSAGGSYASAADLLRFVQALRQRKIAQGSPPGLGIAGGSPGVSAVIEGALPGDIDLVILANIDPPIAESLSQIVRRWLGVRDN